MAVTVYRSSDSGAPALSGQTGKMLDVLYACLVTGYGSKSGAGWTRAYNGTNKSVFRAGGGTQSYLRADDSVNAQYGYMCGYLSMTDIDTGTNPYPTTSQLANGCYFYKSTSSDSVARSWILVADNKRFYMSIQISTTPYYVAWFFGDIKSFAANDSYCSLIVGGNSTNYSASNLIYLSNSSNVINGAGSDNASFIAKNYNGIGSSLQINKIGNANFVGSITVIGSATLSYPNAADNGLYMGPIFVNNDANKLRGLMPGMWQPFHTNPIAYGDTFGGVGGMTGKTFIALYGSYSTGTGSFFIETSDTWDN